MINNDLWAKAAPDYLDVATTSVIWERIRSKDGYTTFYKTNSGVSVVCGCFEGSIGEFEYRVREIHKGTQYETQYVGAIKYVKTIFSQKKNRNSKKVISHKGIR